MSSWTQSFNRTRYWMTKCVSVQDHNLPLQENDKTAAISSNKRKLKHIYHVVFFYSLRHNVSISAWHLAMVWSGIWWVMIYGFTK